ncbi:MAG: S8 family serine peptidase, partial [Acidobacteriota bacterium]
MRRSSRAFAFLLALIALTGLAASSGELPRPSLEIEFAGEVHQVWVGVLRPDGQIERHLVHESALAVEPAGTGRVGRAMFANWESAAGERWSTFSRDDGESWSPARPIKTEIRLRDEAVSSGESWPAVPAGFALPAHGELYVVQFRSVGLPEWRSALGDRGATVFQYLPYNAHIVRIPPPALDSIATLDFVERIEPYHPWYRLPADVRAWLEQADEYADASDAPRRLRVMALEWGAAGKRRVAQAAISLGATVEANTPHGHIVELWLTRGQLRQLAAHDDVLWADFWTPAETDMDLVREDSGANWVEDNFGFCGQGVRGEVMDSGIQSDHPDFDGILLHTSHDTASHGTSTYGIVFGNGNRDGDGEAKATGHMPCAEQGIFADYGSVSDRFAHTQELKGDPYFASFQTNSWGDARTRSYTSVSHEMDDIIWRLDIAITQSQSNAGNQDSRPQAWAKNIISVGGIKHKDTLTTTDDDWTNGGSIGPAEDGRIKPDVNYWYDSIYTTTTGSSYTSGFGGTSAATPESAGVLGLMVQMWSENVWNTDPVGSTVFEKQPHFATIKALLINNA